MATTPDHEPTLRDVADKLDKLREYYGDRH